MVRCHAGTSDSGPTETPDVPSASFRSDGGREGVVASVHRQTILDRRRPLPWHEDRAPDQLETFGERAGAKVVVAWCSEVGRRSVLVRYGVERAQTDP